MRETCAMALSKLVSVNIVTFNSEKYIRKCLDSVFAQSYPHIEVRVFDNGSKDGTCSIVKDCYPRVELIESPDNLMFARAHNECIAISNGEYILPLNHDIVLDPDYVRYMVEAIEYDDDIGSVSGKLYRAGKNLEAIDEKIFDSTGLYFTLCHRHFDRGSNQPDTGQYESVELIFGPSGAAPLYKRAMLDDVGLDGEYFDNDFVFYREDADLAWRAQIMGWRSVYTPLAIGYHIRSVLPEDRHGAGTLVNMHSVKNRFLLRIKNETPLVFLKTFCNTAFRDLLVIGYVLLVERTSVPGLLIVLKRLPATWRKRRCIMAKKRVSDRYLARWFSNRPVTFPIDTGK